MVLSGVGPGLLRGVSGVPSRIARTIAGAALLVGRHRILLRQCRSQHLGKERSYEGLA